MKKYIVSLITCGLPFILSAQPSSPAAIQEVMDVPVLLGTTTISSIPPNAGRLCFDKYLELRSQDPERGRELTTHLYINTQLGYYGYHQNTSESEVIRLNPDTDGFRFTLVSLAGNTYQYYTRVSGERVKRIVTTHNSDFYHAADRGISAPGSLFRQDETGLYGHRRSVRLSTTVYQPADGMVKFHLYGASLPGRLEADARTRILGLLGVGYILLENKLFLSMAMLVNGKEQTRVYSIQKEEHCLDTDGFVVLEDDMYNKKKAQLSREREKILRETGISTTCASQELALKNYRLQMLDREELMLEKSVVGNSLTDEHTREAFKNVYFNYEDQLQLMIYQQEKKICESEADLARRRSHDAVDERNLACDRRQLARMRSNLADMRLMNTRYPNDEPRQLMEKSRLLLNLEPCN